MMNQMNQYGAPTQQQQQQQSNMYNQRPDQMQQQFQSEDPQRQQNPTNLRRNSRVLTPQDRPATGGIGQTLNDRFKYYLTKTVLLLNFIILSTYVYLNTVFGQLISNRPKTGRIVILTPRK